MTKICFIRHGETDWNINGTLQGQKNTSLNEKGRAQAETTGVYLANNLKGFDLLVTSSLNRAKETAEIMNRHLQLPMIELDALKERAFGEAEGLSHEERHRRFPDMEYPGQEKETDFYERVVGCFQEITAEYANKHILLVSHGLVINLILSLLLKEKINYQQTALLNGCINHIHYDQDTWKVGITNQVDHLSK